MNFLKPTDSEAFLDWPKVDFKSLIQKNSWMKNYVECPQCFGHGGWNLRINAYPLHGKENTPENRHLYSHFRCHCDQCYGYGYVPESETNHIHDWQWKKNTGNCLNLYECIICKKQREIDSSD